MNSSLTMTRFAPGRSSVPCEHDFAVATMSCVRTVTPARRMRGSESRGKSVACSSGAPSAQSPVPSKPPARAIATSVIGSLLFSRSGPARK